MNLERDGNHFHLTSSVLQTIMLSMIAPQSSRLLYHCMQNTIISSPALAIAAVLCKNWQVGSGPWIASGLNRVGRIGVALFLFCSLHFPSSIPIKAAEIRSDIPVELDTTTYALTAAHSGKVLTVDTRLKDGGSIMQSTWTGARNQAWKFHLVDGKFLQIHSAYNDFCAQYVGGLETPAMAGMTLEQDHAAGRPNQHWILKPADDGRWYIHSRVDPNKTWDVAEASKDDWQPVQIWGHNPTGLNQQWTLTKVTVEDSVPNALPSSPPIRRLVTEFFKPPPNAADPIIVPNRPGPASVASYLVPYQDRGPGPQGITYAWIKVRNTHPSRTIHGTFRYQEFASGITPAPKVVTKEFSIPAGQTQIVHSIAFAGIGAGLVFLDFASAEFR